ncbi:MAG: hypothetical protein HRU13_11350 [Phycisphaerales bacterium]|nr:hypothetical protein [Phycisphaerales bacterium]
MAQNQTESLGSLIDDFDRQSEPKKGSRGGGGSSKLPPKNVILSVVVLGCLIGAAVFAARALRTEVGSLERWSQERTLIDIETGEIFEDFRVADGVAFPLENPNTGTVTLMPAEACNWTRDGRAKWDPTWVYVPVGESVECPDCGRPVVGRNPQPPVELMLEALDRKEAGEG